MNLRQSFALNMITAWAIVGTGFVLSPALAAPGGPPPGAGIQVLTRGPVHEAFAETVSFDPEPGMIVPQAPPAAIDELPPEQRPEGANVTWIPGYWAWDDEQSSFLWVSGIWRALPPGREWVAGYWGRIAHGVQWTSGYWAGSEASETEYLPAPPETVEAGATAPAPSADYSWVPGCWVWHEGQYAWRPGYWAPVQPNWDWIPDHYIYTPRGFVFVSGYWDYTVARRGVLFAPVHFDAVVYTRPGFSYSPATVIDLGVFADQLFVRPRYHHYYFGDYYAASYRAAGFYSPSAFHATRSGYDPIYAQQRWEHRKDGEWAHRTQAEFQRRRDHEEARPVRTLALQISLSGNKGAPRDKALVVAGSLDQMAKRKDGAIRFQPVAKPERQQLVQRGKEVEKFRVERQKLETAAPSPATGKPSREAGPARLRLPRSPIVAGSVGQLGKGQGPPKSPQTPKPDLRVKPTNKSNDASKESDKRKDR